jgi:hypothetical protein
MFMKQRRPVQFSVSSCACYLILSRLLNEKEVDKILETSNILHCTIFNFLELDIGHHSSFMSTGPERVWLPSVIWI